MDYFFVGPSNGTVGLTDIYLKTKFKLSRSFISIHAHNFLTGSTQLSSINEVLPSRLGTELDFVYSNPIKKDLNLKIGYAFLLASHAMKILRNRNGAFNSWYWVMFTATPKLFYPMKKSETLY